LLNETNSAIGLLYVRWPFMDQLHCQLSQNLQKLVQIGVSSADKSHNRPTFQWPLRLVTCSPGRICRVGMLSVIYISDVYRI